MIIYPAIDLKSGKCVRLYQGKMDEVTVYSNEPAEVAMGWQTQGASFLHLVDLDGAALGEPQNLESIEEIVKSVTIPVQLGGGLRSFEAIEWAFGIGVERVVLGTAAVKDEALLALACSTYPGQIAVGLDVRDGHLAISGWEEDSGISVQDILDRLQELGVSRIIYTDIMMDGTLMGPNLMAIEEIAAMTDIPIIASGGVSSLQDIADLAALSHLGIEGAIVGKALYAEAFSLREAIEVAG